MKTMQFKEFLDSLTEQDWLDIIKRSEEMQMEKLEDNSNDNSEQTILEGEFQPSTKKIRHFKTLTALLDYCKVFNIENAGYGKGYLTSPIGEQQLVFQLEYIGNDD